MEDFNQVMQNLRVYEIRNFLKAHGACDEGLRSVLVARMEEIILGQLPDSELRAKIVSEAKSSASTKVSNPNYVKICLGGRCYNYKDDDFLNNVTSTAEQDSKTNGTSDPVIPRADADCHTNSRTGSDEIQLNGTRIAATDQLALNASEMSETLPFSDTTVCTQKRQSICSDIAPPSVDRPCVTSLPFSTKNEQDILNQRSLPNSKSQQEFTQVMSYTGKIRPPDAKSRYLIATNSKYLKKESANDVSKPAKDPLSIQNTVSGTVTKASFSWTWKNSKRKIKKPDL